MHNIACNFKFRCESFYLQHSQMNKNSEEVKKKGLNIRSDKKILVEKANAVPVLGMKRKKKKGEQNTNHQSRQLSKKRGECTRTFNSQTCADVEHRSAYHWQRKRCYSRRQVKDKSSLLV